MAKPYTFPNLQSRILFKRAFENQFVIPEDPDPKMERFLKMCERRLMKIDISDIEIDRAIFMVTLPRTGGSMLQNLLCTHDNIAYITNSMHAMRSCFCAAETMRRKLKLNVTGERYLHDSVIVDADTPADGVAFWGDWLGEDPDSLDYVYRTIDDYTPEQIDRMKTDIRKMIWCFGGKGRRFFTKNPGLLPHIPLLAQLFPDAKFVHIIRDPRNCANSLLKLHRMDNDQLERIRARGGLKRLGDRPFIPYPRVPGMKEAVEKYGDMDIRTTAHLWNDSMNFVQKHKDKLPTFTEMRHEDLLAHPREEVQRIFDFCELPQISDQNWAFEKSVKNVGVVHHKNDYSDFEVIEDICREQMKHYNYL